MEDLLALVAYVNPNRMKRLAFFGGGTKEHNGLIGRFYKDIASQKYKTDREACQAYFQQSNDQRYRRLRARLVDLLSNAVLLVEGKHTKQIKTYEAIVFLKKQLHVAELLWYDGYYNGAAVILKRHLSLAYEIEATDYLATALPLLRYHAVIYLRSEKKFEEYDALGKKWVAIRTAEEDIKALYDRLMIKYAVSTIPNQRALAKVIKEGLDWHHKHHKGVDTEIYIFHYHMVRFTGEIGAGNFKKAIAICWQAIDKLKSKPHSERAFVRVFLAQIAINAIRFEGFQESRKAILENIKLSSEGSGSWFRTHQIYVYVCIQSEQYKEAVKVSNRVFKHNKFRSLPDVIKERFYLLRAFLYWLIESKSIDTGSVQLDRFHYRNFYGEMVLFSRDKQGFNIPLLILQILWYIKEREYEVARSRIEGLRRYCSRHLQNKEELKRTYYFVKIMLQLGRANFNKERFEQYSKHYYDAMEKRPRPLDQQSLEVEIVPYERLYGMIIQQLNNKVH